MKRNNTRAFLMDGISFDTELILVGPVESVIPPILQEVSVGFVLIEVMVSSCVLVVLAVLSMSYAARVYLQTCQMLQVGTRYVQMQVVLDVLARDVSQAPIYKRLWPLTTSTQHVWTTVHGDVGFENTSRGIVRSKGVFDSTRKKWVRRTKSFFPSEMSYTLVPVSQDHASVYLVCLKITSVSKQCVTTTVALRSGVCL